MKTSSAQKLGPRGSNAPRAPVQRTSTHSGTLRVSPMAHSGVTRNQTSIRQEPSRHHQLPAATIEAPNDQQTSRSFVHAPSSSGRTTQRIDGTIKTQYEQTTSAKVSRLGPAESAPFRDNGGLLAAKSRQTRGPPPPVTLEKTRASIIEKARPSAGATIRADRSVPPKTTDYSVTSRVYDPPTPAFRVATPSRRPSFHPSRTPTALHTPTYGAVTETRRGTATTILGSGLTTPSHHHHGGGGVTPSHHATGAVSPHVTAHKNAVQSSYVPSLSTGGYHSASQRGGGGVTPHNSGGMTPHGGGGMTPLGGSVTPLGGGGSVTPLGGGGATPLGGSITPINGTTTTTTTTTYTPHVMSFQQQQQQQYSSSSRYRDNGSRTPTYGHHPLSTTSNNTPVANSNNNTETRHHRGQTPVHTMPHSATRRSINGSSTPSGTVAALARITLSKPSSTTNATTTTTPTSTYRASNSTLQSGFTRAAVAAASQRQSDHKRLPFYENPHMTKDASGSLAPTPLADGAHHHRAALFPTHKSYTPTNATTAASTPSQHTPPLYSPVPVSHLRRHDEPIVYEEQIYKILDGKPLNHTKILKDAPSQLRSICISPRRGGRCYKLTRVLQSAIYGGVFEAEIYDRSRLRLTTHQKPTPIGRAAVKIMLRAVEIQHKDSLQEDIEAEVNFQEEMKGHLNVLSYDELWEDKERQVCFVIMPFAEFEDLFEVLRKRGSPFWEDEARWLFRQLLSGVQHLHSKDVGFRDHSLENVLMFRGEKDQVVPKITDPGQAVKFRRDAHGRPIELKAEKLFGKSFRPPEVYPPIQTYDPVKVDVFCMGWMLFFVVTKRQPFDRVQKDKEWSCIERGEFEKVVKAKSGTRTLSDQLVDLLKHMLEPHPKRRYDPAQCLAHPWFKNADTPIDAQTILSQSKSRRR